MCIGDNAVKPTSPKLTGLPLRKLQSLSPNTVKNQKYNAFALLSIVFSEQSKFFFNLYFLLVALSQFVTVLEIGLRSFPLRRAIDSRRASQDLSRHTLRLAR